MATTLALAMRASMSAGGVVAGANQASNAMDKMGRHAEQTARDVSVLKNIAIGDLLSRGASMAADALLGAGRAALNYTASVSQALDSTNDLANRVGMSVESLQSLQIAARLAGVDDVTTAIQKMAVAIGKAAETGKTDAFTKLGINFDELRQSSPEEQFRIIQAAIAALPTTADRAAAAVRLFGRSGVELLPLMEQNIGAIEVRLRELGVIVSTEQVGAIAEMNDAFDMVKATIAGIVGQVVGNLAPVVTAITETFLEFVAGYNSVSGSGGTGVANAITDGLFSVIESLAAVVDAAVANFDAAAQVFKTATNILVRVAEFLPGGSAITALKLAGMAAGNTVSERTVAQDFVRGVRSRYEESQTPEAKARRKQLQDNRDSDRKAAAAAAAAAENESKAAEEAQKTNAKMQEDAKRAAEKAARDADAAKAKQAAEAKRRQEETARSVAAIEERAMAKQAEADKIQADKAAALEGTSNQALKASDIRSTEGMAQFIALATGREDPAIEENRKTNQKLEEIRRELRALQQEKVDILGAAA